LHSRSISKVAFILKVSMPADSALPYLNLSTGAVVLAAIEA